ncbi:helix-turn-helix transcriptional regulator [Marinicella rhabdoformis]|uniref:helix-turn-helix transcriptional regulator n=1 Tax=Marinicella rhabdoformis TaxID=2580566 RepID=UPI0015CFDDFB|nr:hypothetical protein [Marinicella rhabdoformis]
MYELTVNSEVIQSIYDMPLGKSNWLSVAEHLGEDLSAASITVSVEGTDHSAWVLAEADFISNTAMENTFSKVASSPEEILGHKAVQGVELHIERKQNADCSLVKQAVGHVNLSDGIKLLIDLLPHPDKKEYSSIDLWRFQYYLIHIKKALDSEGLFGAALPGTIYDSTLQRKYNLSQAESRLLVSLYENSCLKTAAEQLKRSDHTVRCQFKNILKKTNTNNQLALFKKIMA